MVIAVFLCGTRGFWFRGAAYIFVTVSGDRVAFQTTMSLNYDLSLGPKGGLSGTWSGALVDF